MHGAAAAVMPAEIDCAFTITSQSPMRDAVLWTAGLMLCFIAVPATQSPVLSFVAGATAAACAALLAVTASAIADSAAHPEPEEEESDDDTSEDGEQEEDDSDDDDPQKES